MKSNQMPDLSAVMSDHDLEVGLMGWLAEGPGVEQLVDTLRSQLEKQDLADQHALLDEYFDPAGGYTGGMFERLGARIHDPNEIGCHDLLSLSLLDAPASGSAVEALLTDDDIKRRVSSLLGQMADLDIWEADETSLDAADELWEFIRGQRNGMGETRTSKLLARKRPRLIPITDSVIRAAIPMPEGVPDRWVGYRSAFLAEPQLLDRLQELQTGTRHAKDISLLRIFDVLVWRQRGEPERAGPEDEYAPRRGSVR